MNDDDLDPQDELYALTRQIIDQLRWQEAGGARGIPGAPVGARVRVAARPAARANVAAAAPPAAVPTSSPAPAAPRALGSSAPTVTVAEHGVAGLALVRNELGDCTRCRLSGGRQNIVYGVGDANAPLMFVGEAPGADEDRTGEPFVGAAGQLLTKMIEAMGFSREQVYIANIIKCRPPGNRNPEPDEIASCEPFLKKQIAAIRPRMLVCLGKFAAQTLLKTEIAISKLRGTFQQYEGIPLMPTFHPAFLLRNPDAKKEVWSDLRQVMSELDRLGISRQNIKR